MKAYRVGGAVRDRLLGRPAGDNDWVVVGATPEEMIAQGFRQVGRDFPVFIHPDNGEEFALARTERKSGTGYTGFVVHAEPDVTLEQDLLRRDLTINAIAEDEQGRLIDPFNGRADLEQRILRHVSAAFSEDPLRVLRVARFAARFDFKVADETLQLMRDMVASGELATLVPERVWTETERALGESFARRYFDVLDSCGALAVVFPEVAALRGVPQPPVHHPEIDTGVHTMMVLEQACRRSPHSHVRFAALVHDLGKATTPREHWPGHRGHEERSVRIIEALCDRYRIPNRFRDLAIIVARHHGECHRVQEMRPDTILRKLEAMDAFRRPKRFGEFLVACEADACGRTGREDMPYPQADIFRRAFEAARAVTVRDLDTATLEGEAIAAAIHAKRVGAIESSLVPAQPGAGAH